MLAQIEGCRGLSMLVDRETGHCIATSSWESEATMRDSDEQLRPIRDRGRDILGGSMQVDEWEIAIMHRTHHGECCRVSWLQGDLDAMTETVRVGILPELEQTPGFCSASLLVNRSTGLCCATTAWETREAMEASRPSADNMRTRTATRSGRRDRRCARVRPRLRAPARPRDGLTTTASGQPVPTGPGRGLRVAPLGAYLLLGETGWSETSVRLAIPILDGQEPSWSMNSAAGIGWENIG